MCRLPSSQPFTNLVRNLMFPSSQPDWAVLYSLFLELDRHGELVARVESLVAGVLKLSRYQSVRQSPCCRKRTMVYSQCHRDVFEVCEGLLCLRVR